MTKGEIFLRRRLFDVESIRTKGTERIDGECLLLASQLLDAILYGKDINKLYSRFPHTHFLPVVEARTEKNDRRKGLGRLG